MLKLNRDLCSMDHLESVSLVDGKLEVQWRRPNSCVRADGSSLPDRVFKDVYVVRNGEIVLDLTMEAKVTQAFMVPERLEWPNE